MSMFSGDYEFYLNSEDLHDNDLPLTHSRAKGGTMVLWHISLSPYIRVLPTSSSSFVSVLLSPPNILPSVHTGVYLPTAGRDGEWLNAMAELEHHLMEISEKYENFASFLRGDFNASSKNASRASILSAFIARLDLTRVSISHNTYHHFTGGGESDSDLDIILYSDGANVSEQVSEIVCELEHPTMSSHHDLIASTFTLPPIKLESVDVSNNVTAPRVPNHRFSTRWSDEGVSDYREAVTPLLSQIRETWGNTAGTLSVSIMLSTTYAAMNIASKSTNKVVNLREKFKPKPKIDPDVADAAMNCTEDHKQLNLLRSLAGTSAEADDAIAVAKEALADSKRAFRQVTRAAREG